jgi:hypothetical protein
MLPNSTHILHIFVKKIPLVLRLNSLITQLAVISGFWQICPIVANIDEIVDDSRSKTYDIDALVC